MAYLCYLRLHGSLLCFLRKYLNFNKFTTNCIFVLLSFPRYKFLPIFNKMLSYFWESVTSEEFFLFHIVFPSMNPTLMHFWFLLVSASFPDEYLKMGKSNDYHCVSYFLSSVFLRILELRKATQFSLSQLGWRFSN